jgi:hypothetical protein
VGGACSTHKRIAYKVSIRKPEGKQLERPKYLWQNNMKMDIKEI